MMSEGFDEVDINVVGAHRPRRESPLAYMYKQRHSNNLRSSLALMNDNSYETLPMPDVKESPRAQNSPLSTKMSNTAQPNPVVVQRKVEYSPSKRLKKSREIRGQDLDDKLTNGDDDEDDELDDSVIMYDVPLSQSLVQLSENQKMVGSKKLMSFTSDTTRTSSIMSSGNSHDMNSDFELDVMNDDAMKLTMEFCKSDSVHVSQEYDARRHLLNQIEVANGIEDSHIPPSAMKQKLLASTRPSHLPPKPKVEAQRHLRQVERLKSQALKAELASEQARLKHIKELERLKSQDYLYWERKIIPNFEDMIEKSSTREVWWRSGVPNKYRKFVWVQLLAVKSASMLKTLPELRSKAQKLIDSNTPLVQKLSDELDKVFIDVGSFQTSLNQPLLQVLTMYYVQNDIKAPVKGLCSLASILLYNVQSVNETYLCLCGLLQRHVLKSLYAKDMDRFHKEAESFLRTFDRLNPRLSQHITRDLRLPPERYLVPLLQTMFANLLSLEMCSVIMDVYIFEGDSFLWRCILTLFDKIGYRLYGNESEISDVIGWDALRKLNDKNVDRELWVRYLDLGHPMDFLDSVRKILKK